MLTQRGLRTNVIAKSVRPGDAPCSNERRYAPLASAAERAEILSRNEEMTARVPTAPPHLLTSPTCNVIPHGPIVRVHTGGREKEASGMMWWRGEYASGEYLVSRQAPRVGHLVTGDAPPHPTSSARYITHSLSDPVGLTLNTGRNGMLRFGLACVPQVRAWPYSVP
ncbi:hypothetical protein CC85DRAFT_168888 [Cutaneotrichosporon oleaginosum]|uniref:Uncharacterized protein n=1 Tax=Cutaneotrichosporon oleaginosum TaxID=879819 RepID=A0A0J0XV89_9TREE|nr:uncharacterized protein CC85DRAFT_168888 [Cutaneotrichosporon oleaginosum]KLT44977.1 hypothetical protein CC85DRAFT_168888 [Cutaneotrichosporon oleaginosum]TXT09666.1 hypothetical protein COLE_03600 [Cutaneotrichosporon oleaginosum]